MALVPPSSRSGAIFGASLTLTDSQIKALPSTPKIVIAAPGAGRVIVPIHTVWVADTTLGAYTNINAFGVGNPANGATYLQWDALNNADNATGLVSMTDLLGQARVSWGRIGSVEGNLQSVDATLGFDILHPQDISIGYSNGTLSVVATNPQGALTGGNAANTMTVTVAYMLV